MKTARALQTLVRRGSLLAAGALAFALGLPAMDASAGIANTRHNLSTTAGNPDGVRTSNSTEEICVFCHTPHTREASTAGVPLWNKALPGTGYTSYSTLNSTTIDGAFTTVGSVSLACLSCHDGTQAMDNIINAPGYGGYTANGGGVNGLGYTWDVASGKVTAEGLMLNTASTMSMLGSDLTNDHPIGVQYCGGGPQDGAATAACKDRDFVAPQNATINSNLVWWVDTTGGTSATRERTDMILYTRAFGGTNAPSVECASCHDPHVESGTTSGGSGPTAGASFLRVSNAGSAVCLSCHVK